MSDWLFKSLVLIITAFSMNSQAVKEIFPSPILKSSIDASRRCPGSCSRLGLGWLGDWKPYGRYASCICGAQLGQRCGDTEDCAGEPGGIGRPGVHCCNGKCEKKVRDWIGVYYCKFECVGTCTQID